MSCQNGTSPINVKQTNNKCSVSCHYTYNYGLSSLTAKNKNNHLSLSYDKNISNVKYNNISYDVEDIRIYKPSLNQYNGKKMDAEIIIHHVGDGAENLLVCVPIKSNNMASSSSTFFSKIMRFAPSKNETTSINVSDYTLNHIIPRGGYYAYVGNLPYQPCSGKYNIILFNPDIAPNMKTSDMTILGRIISKLTPKIQNISNSNLYYNEKGTTDKEMSMDDDIYIKCTALDEDGKPIQDSEGQLRSSIQEPKESVLLSKEREKYIQYAKTGGEIVGGIALMYILYRIGKKMISKFSQNNE